MTFVKRCADKVEQRDRAGASVESSQHIILTNNGHHSYWRPRPSSFLPALSSTSSSMSSSSRLWVVLLPLMFSCVRLSITFNKNVMPCVARC